MKQGDLLDEERLKQLEYHYRSILSLLGEDPNREGLLNTPRRTAKAMSYLTQGYRQSAEEVIKSAVFDYAGSQMIIVRNIEFYSMCEHHILPFFGTISFGYIPNNKIIGISKLVEVVDIFARRLQIQENLTTQIADTFMNELKPKGVMVVTEATHLCMIIQGVENKNAKLITSAVRGIFKEDARSRNEFMTHIK